MLASGFKDAELEMHYRNHVGPQVRFAPWILRVTEHKDKPAPVLVVKERVRVWADEPSVASAAPANLLKERGYLYGQALRRCRPVLRRILANVCDGSGIPLELNRYLGDRRISFRGNLPLDAEAGDKLALLFKLQERVSDMDRVELMAWRIERFTAEEAAYWLTRITQYGDAPNRWAQAGLRILLGGQPGDPTVLDMLQQLRQ
ncbi:MAG: hypothetical protein K6T81_02650 [Alicyclobacillus macrosporangiidus]|uniref:DUF7680 family protein n=1 Tax=Alicyclobacillus macrosporangiidus TaxID=392015 RepID=UPI0026EEA176|nr:hypothetical protein [Alicyclobacillus macrosporangiidus]MCL6597624.1 hypothetical protein [Alicyclobacillus macrosporangiidus]